MMKKGLTINQFIITRVAFIIAIILIIVPILWVISIAFRSPDTVYKSYFFFIPEKFSIENFILLKPLFNETLGISMSRMFFNSIFVTVVSLIISFVIFSISAFSFGNYIFKGKEFLFIMLLMAFFVPKEILFIPLYVELGKMKLLDTPWALILTYVTFNSPIVIMILRSFFEQIPLELRDAARIDGATDFYYFIRVVIPISRPAIATVGIFSFLGFWNEFLFAVVFIRSTAKQTIPAVVSRIGGGAFSVVPWGTYTAALTIIMIPIMVAFFIFQKWFIQGLTMGAVKG